MPIHALDNLLTLAQASGSGGGGDSNFVAWGVLLLAIAAVLFFMEIFVPSGGLLGLTAGVAAVAGLVMLFMDDSTTGAIGLLLTLLAIPFLIAVALKFWPNTPLAHRMTLRGVSGGSGEHATVGVEDLNRPAELLGRPGKSVTALRPVGTCLIGDKRIECLAEGGIIPAGRPVKVVRADGLAIKVREVEEPDDNTAKDPDRSDRSD